MGSIFNTISLKRPKHSVFDLSYDNKLSFRMGKLVPTHVQECVPGDKFHMSSEAMFRMMPMLAPIMHKVDIYHHFFFVPNRIIWDGWEKFITGGEDGAIPPAFPYMKKENLDVTASSLGDYLGLPLGNYALSGGDSPISAIPFAAYQRIWFEYYRDQNLQEPDQPLPTLTDGEQTAIQTTYLQSLRDRAWEHDYFTSCLPFAQKGDAVELPIDLTGDLNVIATPPSGPSEYPIIRDLAGAPVDGNLLADVGTGQFQASPAGIDENAYYDPAGTMHVDGEGLTTTTTINDLRTAFSLQKWLEKNARAGSRYVESLLSHFGVRSSDKRLQRPEYLGGSKATMAISEVLQTSSTTEDSPQGAMAGHGIGISAGKDFSYYCEEHGYIIGIISVRPKTAYMQGLPRHWSKFDRTLYFWPDFAHLGEQEVKNQEVLYDFGGLPSPNRGTFGYLPRYSEYRENPSRVAGLMRTDLNFWHLARKFDTLPVLNEEFITCIPDTRIFAVEEDESDNIIAHIFQKIVAKRPMPKYGNPGSI